MGDRTADDLFAGAGGWDVAANWLDIHARGVENMPAARATRDAAGLTTIHDDVWTFTPDGEATGLIASPPCQTFSPAGNGTGRKALDDVLRAIESGAYMDRDRLQGLGAYVGDPRTALVLAPLHYAATNENYRWLAWEQVPTVLPVWEACAEVLRGLGWSVWTGILHAEQYGVAQTRKRAFLLASRDIEVTPPTPTHSRFYVRSPERLDDGVAKWVSMAEALGWPTDTQVVSNYGTGGDPTKRGVRCGDEPSATVTSKVDRNIVYRGSNAAHAAIRDSGEPAPTLVFGHQSNDVRWYPRGSTERGVAEFAATRSGDSRRVTVQEAAALQGFPIPYPLEGSATKQYLQVGNAVPPPLAMAALCAATGEPFVPPDLTPFTEPAQPALATI